MFVNATPIYTGVLPPTDPGKPSGAGASHLLLAILATARFGTPNGFDAPAGWTRLITPEDFLVTNTGAFSLFWARGDVASTEFTRAGTGQQDVAAQILSFSGRNLTDPVSAIAPPVTTGNQSLVIPGMVGNQVGDDCAWLFMNSHNNEDFTLPGSIVVRGDSGTTVGLRIVTATLSEIGAGDVGSRTATWPENDFTGKGGIGIRLLSASAGGSGGSSSPIINIITMG